MKENVIFDVGLHTGEDTDFYLRKGYTVVGIEANPEHVAAAKVRFQEEIARGLLHLLEGAIAPPSSGDKVVFYVSQQSDWGTIHPKWALRNEMLGQSNEQIEVNRLDMADLYRTYGIPFYLKIDIEGLDRFVLEELKQFPDRPCYVSLESEKVDYTQLIAELELLQSLGYTKFKVVQQETIPGQKIKTRTRDGRPLEYEFAYYASGPFGDDLPRPWLEYDETVAQYRSIFRRYKYFGDNSIVRKMPAKAQAIFRQIYRMSTQLRWAATGLVRYPCQSLTR